MKNTRLRVSLYILTAVLCLAIWINLRPLSTGQSTEEDTLGRLNAAYLLISDGLLTVLILAAIGLCGSAVIKWLGIKNLGPWQLSLFGMGLGITILSIATLLLGLAGFLNRPLFIAILTIMALLGVVAMGRVWLANKPAKINTIERSAVRWLGLAFMPLATLALIASLIPAGILWNHDGRGYDSLEYHLQLPKEYFQAGQIQHIPNNIFSNLPQNAEMLYLNAMILKADHVDGMYLAQLLNYAVSILFVWGIYIIFRHRSRLGAALAATAATTAQLFFVATNTYVESYQLLMFLLAVGILIGNETKPSLARALLAGIFAGSACGTKYTAIVMIVPVVLAVALAIDTARIKRALIILLAAIAVFSPWMLKNIAFIGNPIFPLATKTLGQGDYPDQLIQRWQTATQPTPDRSAPLTRLQILAQTLTHPAAFGTTVAAAFLVLAIAIIRRTKWTILTTIALLAAFWQIAIWTTLTHLQPRFLLVLLLPAAIIIVDTVQNLGEKWKGKPALAIVCVLIIGINSALCGAVYEQNTKGFFPWFGRDEFIASAYPFGSPAAEIPPNTKLLLIGEARPFYIRCDTIYNTVFDRSILAEKLRQTDAYQTIQWLKEQGITHLYINWMEVQRLKESYGFDPEINPTTFLALEGAGLITQEKSAGPNHHTILYRID